MDTERTKHFGAVSGGNLREYYARGIGVAGDVGSLAAETRFGGGEPETVFLHADWRGCVVLATDAAGNAVGRYGYSAYGEPFAAGAANRYAPRFGFSSKERDASGLVYYGFRHASPELCRWITPAPARESGGLNLYRFTKNNPVSYCDNDGAAPRYVYPGVTATYDRRTGRSSITPSPDIDWGGFDSDFGGGHNGLIRGRGGLLSGSVSGGITLFMGTHEIISTSGGCVYYCMSYTPSELVGIGISGSVGVGRSRSPVMGYTGIGRHLSVGVEGALDFFGADITANYGLSLSLFPAGFSLRLFCVSITSAGRGGCPCNQNPPPNILGKAF